MIVGVIVGLVVLVLLVVVHELGHALVAKRNGVVVEEFGIGFPPRAKKWKVEQSFLGKDVTFSINWLPLGGFVRLKGEYDAAEGRGMYGSATFWVKTKILLAGVAMNWLTAAVLFSILAVVGLPKILPQQLQLPFDTSVYRSPVMVAKVEQGSPAGSAGLKVHDQIVAIDGKRIMTSADLSAMTKSHAGREITVTYKRHGAAETSMRVQLRDSNRARSGGYLGVTSQQTEKLYSTWSAPIVGVAVTGQLSYETVKGIGDVVGKSLSGLFGQFFHSGEAKQAAQADLETVSKSVMGPIGILGVLFPSIVQSGIVQVLLLAAIISLTLAVMNILPIPGLDGGRWVTMAVFRLFRKKLTREREESIQAIGMMVLLLLTILVTVSDIKKFF